MSTLPYLCGWENQAETPELEVRQLQESGHDPDWLAHFTSDPGWNQISPDEQGAAWELLQKAPLRSGWIYEEPNGLEAIRAAREDPFGKRRFSRDTTELEERMLGAWLGRCCGCALGKPLEAFLGSRNGLRSRERLKLYLEGAGAYPLRNYTPGRSAHEEETGRVWCPDSQLKNIRFMESDDDIRYTVLSQKVLKKHGLDFTTWNVMDRWLTDLPYRSVCTAETQAYRNYILRYHIHGSRPEGGLNEDWEWVATYQNPYREWIGAQIRADSWGYAAPGDPGRAAEYAWRDARMSHIGNGIYGEMLAAAMIAAAFVADDPWEIVRAGLGEIPRQSRLWEDVSLTVDWCRRSEGDYESVFDKIAKRLGHYSPVHTNNNAALVAAGLLLGEGDFEKSITIAVMGGLDTDCNGATVGSIVGVMKGAGAIPDKWKRPLNDTLYSAVDGYHPIAISECARRSVEIARLTIAP